MKNVVQYVFSWMYQNNKNISFFEKFLISSTTVLALLILLFFLTVEFF